ncbi:MAG TPA: DUF1552 domain-containing protein [Tepidisphaeraceae bacterium]|jgi:hypothetical protein|nr:DUF1552 domain-containing protein [Tepidisphaeraceae bacterium]
MSRTRRQFIRDLGLSAAAIPFVLNLPGMAFANQQKRKQRIIFMFSPNGIVRKNFWPDEQGANFKLKEILSPLAPYQDKMLVLNGLADRIRGDGDGHMRGMGCLLTGIELFPGNIQGGSDTPAGWSKGISIDQEIRNFLQKDEATRTRFGSLEFGVMVPDRADTWTRWIYAGPNKPVAPIDDPQQMFAKLYGRAKDEDALKSVLDDVNGDLKKVSAAVGSEDRRLLDEHATFVREMEEELRQSKDAAAHPVPVLEPGVRKDNDHIPQISKQQIDLMINAFTADFTRVASMQYTNSVGNARMRWLGIDDAHHALSHEPNAKTAAQEKLVKIDKWFCEQLAYMTKRLAETPEPGGSGSLLDNTLVVWTNELGEGNTHSLDNIPFVLVGGGLDFKMGQSLKFPRTPHNRLLMALAGGFGHHIDTFGNPNFCGEGAMSLGA